MNVWIWVIASIVSAVLNVLITFAIFDERSLKR